MPGLGVGTYARGVVAGVAGDTEQELQVQEHVEHEERCGNRHLPNIESNVI